VDNKIFWSVLGALVAFAVLCGFGYLVYQDNDYQAKIDSCVQKMEGKLIFAGADVSELKPEIMKECRAAYN
jgi:hypothetical protein